MTNKIVVVTGATGHQGRAVIDGLLKHGGCHIRGLSRNVAGEAAKGLAAKGVEMVVGHLLDRDSLLKAFAGAYAVFGVTLPFLPEGEVVQGHNLVDACKANDVPLLVWSSLPSARALSNGKYTGILYSLIVAHKAQTLMFFRHFDQKAAVDGYMRSVAQPGVVLNTGTFVENILNCDYLKPDADKPDEWHIYTPILGPDAAWPYIYIGADLGAVVVGIIENWQNDALRAELSKEPLVVVKGTVTGKEMAGIIHRVTGKACDYITVPADVVPAFVVEPYTWANEGFFTYGDKVDPPILGKLGVRLHTFEEFVKDLVVPFMEK
ncbi:NAD(P)-binding protein [Calocera cornea HHB12733]|uniref:NAD(P)-binding protein n=1 Tax=Calocera cornea HHB12733 TaxID=1353952 RepID=A0A165HZJ7_9BASI|nr:NAD(P)-binding protein [Calocera cornea HHB12733]